MHATVTGILGGRVERPYDWMTGPRGPASASAGAIESLLRPTRFSSVGAIANVTGRITAVYEQRQLATFAGWFTEKDLGLVAQVGSVELRLGNLDDGIGNPGGALEHRNGGIRRGRLEAIGALAPVLDEGIWPAIRFGRSEKNSVTGETFFIVNLPSLSVIESAFCTYRKRGESLVVSRNFRTLGFLPSGRRRVLRRCVEERTLHRRLKEEGATFRQILLETRGEVAVQLLENSELTIASIASILRYDDPTAFSRAFKSWSGGSPAKWRKDSQDTQS